MSAGKTIEIKGGIYFDPAPAFRGPYVFFEGPLEAFGEYVPLVEHTITFALPDDFDPRTDEIKALEAAIERARAEHTRTVFDINERINKLLCIENAAGASS